ncbi:MAG: metallophosphoesterase [Petrimonas sp.]|uniref:metallophosphoesterase n=1 Tax=Petrimonas sp. TaxID=2023866 RepID=UPI002B39BF16|nr:metallophosphoesterase [Petrimonas sp.]MEA4979023.1 metallophosphoesterase [Petrimonas sp.]MEA5045631.1 metallophosphoesterase [Petrimonas sp.]
MKKNYFLLLLVASIFSLVSCNKTDEETVTNPFDVTSESNNNERNKIVVISDLHLGNDLSYSENVKHLKRLEQFLNEVRSSATIKELVIGGDMLDEWYIPTRTDTYGGGSQADFVRKTVAANQEIFNVLNGIIKDGKIKLTYIPGNHDMGFTPQNINIAMPGVNQARDAGDKFGVGSYHPDGYPQIAIEHGHRYDFFCAITPGANESEAPGATLPPGYFFARIAANSFTDPTTPEAATKVPAATLNNPADAEQNSKYIYYTLWKKVMEEVIYVKDNFSDPIIKTNVGHFTKTYSINDILPQNSPTDDKIRMNLYNDLFTQANWDAREKYNNVTVMTDIDKAIVGSLKTEFIDEQANVQYFRNPTSNVRIVVFGHTHMPMIKSYTNLNGKSCLYANSGTWEDQKTHDKNAMIEQDTLKMNFVMISPVKPDKKKLQVALYQYRYGKHLLKDIKELDL